MTELYCHIHTPVNIEEENKHFLKPIIFERNLYIIKERKLNNILNQIGYLPEYIKFIRENNFNYDYVLKWLKKKNLLNSGFLEEISQYFIEDINLNNISNYKYFEKNYNNQPVISEKYLKNIFQKVILYNQIKEHRDEFNEFVERELNIIEKEFSSVTGEKNKVARQLHYQNRIFDILSDNFFINNSHIVRDKLEEVNKISFFCETLLNNQDLVVYKTGNITGYNNFNFKLKNISHQECLRENTFVKLYASLGNRYSDKNDLNFILNELRTYSKIFTADTVDFGVEHLKKIISYDEKLISSNCKNKFKNINETEPEDEREPSRVAVLQKTKSIISETEEHIISRYNSLKNHTNIYFAPDHEMIMLNVVLNTDKANLNRINNLIWNKSGKIETELVKFTFKKGKLPYSAYGFAGINF